MSNYKPFDLLHPPTIGVVVNWNEGCALLTGWEVDTQSRILVCINTKLVLASELLEKYNIEDHPAGYLEENIDE